LAQFAPAHRAGKGLGLDKRGFGGAGTVHPTFPALVDAAANVPETCRMQALDGIKILDLTRVLAGPWCTQLLADLGATVFKIEKPGEGDDTRSWGPPFAESSVTPGLRMSTYFMSANRGKYSVAIDIAQPEGAAIVRDMAAQCDVLVENFKVGGLAKYGLGFADLHAVNPRLIYCSITGYGQTGPYASRPGYDFIVQGMGGLMGLTGDVDGEPMRAGVAVADLFTGMYATTGILAALHQRHATGLGQHIDVALLDVQVATMANQAVGYLATGRDPARHGNAHASIVPYQVFRVADGQITVAAGNDSQFRKLCAVLGEARLAADARFARNADRVRHREVLIPMLQGAFAGWEMTPLLAALEVGGVPAGPINALSQVFENPQVMERGTQLRQNSQSMGQVPGVRCPIRMSGAEVGTNRAPPVLGEHTDEVLADMKVRYAPASV
jgi:crotonobetainyl-CoA:carnitine CoA-transferase CaiB-like acyl-CoA transferase